MNPDPTNRNERGERHDPYLDAVHEVSEGERGARRLRGEARDAAREAAEAKAEAEEKARRAARENESADPVGDGRGDADYAKKLPGDLPGASRTRDDR